MKTVRGLGRFFAFFCASLLVFVFPSEAASAKNCMQTWLSRANLPLELSSSLWKANLDESNIPQTSAALLGFVLRSGTQPSSTAQGRNFQDCITGKKSTCHTPPCKNGGQCLLSHESDSFTCSCKTGYGGKTCTSDKAASGLECCRQNYRTLLEVSTTAQTDTYALSMQNADMIQMMRADRSIMPTMTSICSRSQAVRGSGVYRIKLPDVQAFTAYCDMSTDRAGPGYLVFQRREDGTVDFYRTYASYTKGFGDVNEEHWLGLELLHRLSTAYQLTMRIDLGDWEGNTAHANYSSFQVGSKATGYRMTITGYSGDAGDGMANTNGQRFSTRDKDQTSSSSGCATLYRGAWWYNACHAANLNSVYERATVTSYANTVCWQPWKGYYYSLKFTEMKMKLSDN